MLERELKNKIIIAYFSEKKKQAEIARELNIPKQTVSSIINNACSNCRKNGQKMDK